MASHANKTAEIDDDIFDVDNAPAHSSRRDETDEYEEQSEVETAVEEPKATTADILSYLSVFIILLILIPATIVSTFEISNRLAFNDVIDQEIAQHKTELNHLDATLAKSNNTQKPKEARDALLSEINTLEKFKEVAHIISTTGAIPLEEDVFSFRELLVLKAKSIQGPSTLSSLLKGGTAIKKSKTLEESPFLAHIDGINRWVDKVTDLLVGFVCNYNSNSLLAIALILSCIIGTLTCHFKKEGGHPVLLRTIISGMVMGFVVYLILKGSKELVIAEGSAIKFSLDIYSSCFIALLAGLFADNVFRLLKALVGLIAIKATRRKR